MIEKIIIKLATLLVEKLLGWFAKKAKQRKVNRREHDRISQASQRLQDAVNEHDTDAAVDDLP
jgi:hypothetical protein